MVIMLTYEVPAGLVNVVRDANVVICFLNGHIVDKHSRQVSTTARGATSAVSVRPLQTQTQRGAVVHVAGQDFRIAILHLYKNIGEVPMATSIKNIYVLDEGLRAEIVEAHIVLDDAVMQIQNMSEAVLAERASLKIGQFSEMCSSCFFNDNRIEVHKGSTVEYLTFSSGGGIVRNEYKLRLLGEGAHSTFLNLVMGKASSQTVNSSVVVHEKGNTKSVQLAKSIMKDSSQFIFSGRLVINQGAQKSDASQYNHNLLLSEQAEVNTQPQLEVLADDVKAVHGATVGALQANELFYLQSRAIPHDQAVGMLVSGFANDLFEKISSNFVVSATQELMSAKVW